MLNRFRIDKYILVCVLGEFSRKAAGFIIHGISGFDGKSVDYFFLCLQPWAAL
jgi:hypothetical protein